MTRKRSLKQEIGDFNMLKFKHTFLYIIKICLLLMLATIQYDEILISKLPIHYISIQHRIINTSQATKGINHFSPHHKQPSASPALNTLRKPITV